MRGELSGTDGPGVPRLIRVAAVGDIHIGRDTPGFTPHQLEGLEGSAHLLLIAGDLTQHGHADEAAALARELEQAPVPVIAVLGNHDYHHGEQDRIREHLERAGVIVLEGEGTVMRIDGVRVGIAGTKGFGGGFAGACGSEFGEEEMKLFIRYTRTKADELALALERLECDLRIALTHYAPVKGTLAGERLEIFPFLGSYLLGEAVDKTACTVAFHGHAHAGTERAVTAAGVAVRNVARPVIKLAYKVYTFDAASAPARTEAQSA